MPTNVTQIKVFISCPSDVEAEKALVKVVCEEINQRFRNRYDVSLFSLDWRQSVVPLFGPRPQGTINEQIGEYDVFIGILWKRFGTPTGAQHSQAGLDYESGTEEEFQLAYDSWKEKQVPLINFFFKTEMSRVPDASEMEQLSKVTTFKQRLKDEYRGWVVDFDSELDFERKVRNFLENIFLDVSDSLGKKKPEPLDSIENVELINVVKREYTAPPAYLPRRVASTDEDGSVKFSFLAYQNSQDTLTVVVQKNRVVLLSEAGAGKSTELKRIAAYFSKSDHPLFPYFLRLNKYTNQAISDLLPPDYRDIPDKNLLVLLDGLDEIESQNRNNAIRQIELFAEQHPASHIIVSCRSNFYRTQTKLSSGSLKDFDSYILLNLNHREVYEYLKDQLGERTNSFERLISEKHLWPLVEIPFYLIHLVSLFETQEGLPNNKAQIFEQLLNEQIKFDVDKFRTTIDLAEKRLEIILTLEIVALAMESLGRNNISTEEYHKIIPDESKRTLLKHCAVWKGPEGSSQQWQFEHNNFQEYLAARILSRQPIAVIKDFIAFSPEYRKIIPSWINTLSFLVSVIKKDDSLYEQVISWIIDSEPEVVVKFEPDKIDPATRVDLVKQIFNYYKERQIPIDRDKFDYSELARFGQSEEIIDFLLTEAENASHFSILVNAIELLGDSEIPPSQRQRTTKLLVKTAHDFEAGEYPQYNALRALTDLRLNSQEIINQLLPVLRTSESDWVRSGLYYMLYNSDYLDENIDIFLEGVRYTEMIIADATPLGTTAHSRLFDEYWHLSKGLERAASPTAIKKILGYFKENPNDLERYSFGEVIATIANNAAKAYSYDPSIFEAATDFFAAEHSSYDERRAGAFIHFFDLTNTRLQAFQRFFVERNVNRDAFSILAFLADLQCIQYFAQQYEERNVTNTDVWTFQYHLNWLNPDLSLIFNKMMNEISGDKFIPPPMPDMKKARVERRTDDLNLLFDKEAFLNEIRLVFEKAQKETLTKDDLFKIRKEEWQSPTLSNLAIQTIGDFVRNDPASVEHIISTINKSDWDFYRAIKVYEKLSNNKDIALTEEQEKILAQWCYANVDKVDFKTAVVQKPGGGGTASWPAILLWYYLRKLHLKYPKEVLLDMLSFEWIEGHQWVGIEYLEELLDEADMTHRILENLERGIGPDDVLRNHYKYAKRHAVREVIPFALANITNAERSNWVRDTALETVCELSESPLILEQVLPEINDGFKWKVVDKLIDKDSGLTHQFLLNVLKNGMEEERLLAAQYLIRLQDIEGLSYYADWVERNMKFTEYGSDSLSLRELKTPSAIPLLVKLLDLSYREGLVQSDFHTLNRAVLDTLNRIALQSEDTYKAVRSSVTQFLEDNISTYKGINFLYQYIDSLERSFYINKSNQITLPEVIAKIRVITNS